ncbi:uncharacterized protein si:ch211-191i18.4 isoform X2 [Perca fluviatilis]|uniref:uncharacterized protein si:ch211-191i18.4 isoform X2 n=1 Tax=Perca fluviatilis TaxID=8168 RepID=UPI001964D8FD|nr:uncharacterized protein si:ch211-191i18.4 isoform X2 [Perca fluviatilis]
MLGAQVHAGRTGACWEHRCMLGAQVEVSESHDFTSLQKKNESHDFTSLQKKESHDFTSLQKKNKSHDFTSLQKKNRLRRLPGLCRRLRRRRVTVLCNREKFCWPTQTQKTRPVQVCLCPRGSRCSHFFVHSL